MNSDGRAVTARPSAFKTLLRLRPPGHCGKRDLSARCRGPFSTKSARPRCSSAGRLRFFLRPLCGVSLRQGPSLACACPERGCFFSSCAAAPREVKPLRAGTARLLSCRGGLRGGRFLFLPRLPREPRFLYALVPESRGLLLHVSLLPARPAACFSPFAAALRVFCRAGWSLRGVFRKRTMACGRAPAFACSLLRRRGRKERRFLLHDNGKGRPQRAALHACVTGRMLPSVA